MRHGVGPRRTATPGLMGQYSAGVRWPTGLDDDEWPPAERQTAPGSDEPALVRPEMWRSVLEAGVPGRPRGVASRSRRGSPTRGSTRKGHRGGAGPVGRYASSSRTSLCSHCDARAAGQGRAETTAGRRAQSVQSGERRRNGPEARWPGGASSRRRLNCPRPRGGARWLIRAAPLWGYTSAMKEYHCSGAGIIPPPQPATAHSAIGL